jgi:hypothetical protein
MASTKVTVINTSRDAHSFRLCWGLFDEWRIAEAHAESGETIELPCEWVWYTLEIINGPRRNWVYGGSTIRVKEDMLGW